MSAHSNLVSIYLCTTYREKNMLVELSTEPEDEYLTNLEITNLIRGLSPADILRLGQIAKKYVYRSLMDADEILSEAIVGRSR